MARLISVTRTAVAWTRRCAIETRRFVIAGMAAVACVAVLAHDLPSAEPPANQAAPMVRVATWQQAQQLIASYKGRVVVVDFWSNFCPPCIAELPQLARIQREFPKDVVCLSINCNFAGDGKPDDERPAVLKVLKEINAPFLTLISADADIDLYGKLGIASIPVIQVYDRNGKLAKQFDNEKNEYGKDGFTYAQHIIPYVRQLAK